MINRDLGQTIGDKAQRREKAPMTGIVTEVYDKESNEDEEGNIEVNVATANPETQKPAHEFRRIPVLATSHNGHVGVPQVGEQVVVEFMLGKGTQPIVVGSSPTIEDRYPHARAGHWRHEWSKEESSTNLYLEAEPADGSAGTPDVIRMGVKQDGLSEPTTELVLDTSNDDPIIKADIGNDEQGIIFDGKDGGFKLLDKGGNGIVSDGEGNLTIHMKDVNFTDESTTTLD